jgi:peptidoglycan hydrolase CwlO-like protein
MKKLLSLALIAVLAIVSTSSVLAVDDNTQVRPTTSGLKIGEAATAKIGAFGVTPVVQPASANQAAVTATSTNGTAGAAADLTALKAEAEKIGDDVRAAIVLLNELRTALVNLGLIKGAAAD